MCVFEIIHPFVVNLLANVKYISRYRVSVFCRLSVCLVTQKVFTHTCVELTSRPGKRCYALNIKREIVCHLYRLGV